MSRRARHDSSAPITLFSFQDIMAAVTGVMILITLLLAIEPTSKALLHEQRRSAPEAAPEKPTSTPAPTDPQATESPDMALSAAQQMVADLEAAIARRRAAPVIDEATLAAMERELESVRSLERDAMQRLQRVVAAQTIAIEERATAQRVEAAAAQALAEATARLERETRRSRVRFLPGERYEKAPLFVEIRSDAIALGGFDDAGLLAPLAAETRVSAGDLDATSAALARSVAPFSPDAYQIVFIVRQDALAPFARLRNDFYQRGWEVGWQIWDANEGGFFDSPKELRP